MIFISAVCKNGGIFLVFLENSDTIAVIFLKKGVINMNKKKLTALVCLILAVLMLCACTNTP